MLKYIIKRIIITIPVLIGAITIVFLLSYITPGDPAQMILGSDATEEQVEALRDDLGLNDPIYKRWFDYVVGIITRFDFGTSYSSGRPIKDEILMRWPTTIKLAIVAVLIASCLGLLLGILAAVKQYSIIDNISMVLAMIGVSMPQFWLGLMLILLFAVKLRALPSSGINNPKGWILPWCTIGICAAATLARTTRSSMLEVIRQDYMRTARAKGVKETPIILKHGLRNALIPILNVISGQFAMQLGGALMIESVFSIPGLGKYMVDAISARNFPAVQGGVVLIAVIAACMNLLVDCLYTGVDPRVKSAFVKAKKAKKVKAAKEGAANV